MVDYQTTRNPANNLAIAVKIPAMSPIRNGNIY